MMPPPSRPPSDLPATLGELRASGLAVEPVHEGSAATPPPGSPRARRSWTGVLGFDDTVLPQLENALLAGPRHHPPG